LNAPSMASGKARMALLPEPTLTIARKRKNARDQNPVRSQLLFLGLKPYPAGVPGQKRYPCSNEEH
jgi:hypothetical protein